MNKITQVTPEIRVESWWDRQSRNWITQILDAEGNQIGDALFSANRDNMPVEHMTAVADAVEIAGALS